MAKPRTRKVRLHPRAASAGEPSASPLPEAVQTKTVRTDRASALRPSDLEFWTVINEVADPAPIVPAELDAIERYFSAVLDDVFGLPRKMSVQPK